MPGVGIGWVVVAVVAVTGLVAPAHARQNVRDFTAQLARASESIGVASGDTPVLPAAHPARHKFARKLQGAMESMELKQRLQDAVAINKTHLTPIVLLHGLNEDVSSLKVLSRWLRYALPGVYVHLLELGDRFDTFFTNMNRQVSATCELLARNPRLQQGFHMVAFTQGALIARGYIQRCNAPPVRSFVSMAGPQMGVFQVPALHDEHADFILQGGGYEEWSQEYLSPAQYFRHPMKPNMHERESSFLADLNNERAVKNVTYKQNLMSLDHFVLVKFSHDEVVVPNESCWFGYFRPFSVDEQAGMREFDVYKQDFIGLKALDEAGRLHLLECKGGHQEFSRGWFYNNIVPFLNTTNTVRALPDLTPRGAHEEL